MCVCVYLYLVDGKSDGVQVSSKASFSSSIFLHQTNQDGAAVFAVVRLVVNVLEADEELRVGAERGCRETRGQSVFIYRDAVSSTLRATLTLASVATLKQHSNLHTVAAGWSSCFHSSQ